MIFGVDYYPEHWDRSEWQAQAKLMKEGGFNTVRMGRIFLWTRAWTRGRFSVLADKGTVLCPDYHFPVPSKYPCNLLKCLLEYTKGLLLSFTISLFLSSVLEILIC